jgi:two-component system response regulator MprA
VVRVLVVDDSGAIRALVRGAIEFGSRAKDVELVEAGDGAEALHVIEKTHVDVVCLDWSMPKIDGVEITKRLRAVGNDVPVIMITANAHDVSREAALAAGVTAYVVKPFRIAQLYAVVEPYLEKARGKRR